MRSSSIVTGFRNVTVAAGLRCPGPDCGHEFKPHDFEVLDDGVVRLMCPACHRVAIEIDLNIGVDDEELE
jgi:hypothetical protein